MAPYLDLFSIERPECEGQFWILDRLFFSARHPSGKQVERCTAVVDTVEARRHVGESKYASLIFRNMEKVTMPPSSIAKGRYAPGFPVSDVSAVDELVNNATVGS